jgi:hypothetical protein
MIEVWQRLLARVQVQPNGCWHWTGPLNNKGYGIVGSKRQGTRLMHRIGYIATNGDPGPDLVIDHLCHNADRECPGGESCIHRRCCNPEHLEAVTEAVNIRRSPVPHYSRTVCPCGTALTEATRAKGTSVCRPCHNARARARWVPRAQRRARQTA